MVQKSTFHSEWGQNFKNLLVSINEKSMREQKSVLDKTMTQWMGDTEQIDDILVIGVRF